jgi:large subunit ribosomal protein L15
MPFRLRPQPSQPVWKVNDQVELVDDAFDKFVGQAGGKGTRGREVLPEEIKVRGMDVAPCAGSLRRVYGDQELTQCEQWQALTHKSFDHGRRPYNDKLAYLGKRILDLQTSLLLLQQPMAPDDNSINHLYVFAHPSLSGLNNITPLAKSSTLDKKRLAQLASSYGLHKVVRWKPRKTDRLESSGQDVVLAQTIYAIVGAVALQKGGDVAAQVARERILAPLGLK